MKHLLALAIVIAASAACSGASSPLRSAPAEVGPSDPVPSAGYAIDAGSSQSADARQVMSGETAMEACAELREPPTTVDSGNPTVADSSPSVAVVPVDSGAEAKPSIPVRLFQTGVVCEMDASNGRLIWSEAKTGEGLDCRSYSRIIKKYDSRTEAVTVVSEDGLAPSIDESGKALFARISYDSCTEFLVDGDSLAKNCVSPKPQSIDPKTSFRNGTGLMAFSPYSQTDDATPLGYYNAASALFKWNGVTAARVDLPKYYAVEGIAVRGSEYSWRGFMYGVALGSGGFIFPSEGTSSATQEIAGGASVSLADMDFNSRWAAIAMLPTGSSDSLTNGRIEYSLVSRTNQGETALLDVGRPLDPLTGALNRTVIRISSTDLAVWLNNGEVKAAHPGHPAYSVTGINFDLWMDVSAFAVDGDNLYYLRRDSIDRRSVFLQRL